MIVIILLSVLLAAISARMVIDPAGWSRNIVSFSEWRWFHPFEIFSRLVAGLALLSVAGDYRYPGAATFVAGLLIAVAAGLALTPASKHREFARWSARHFRPVFRFAGLVTLVVGVFVAWTALLDA